jgi:hypothetical protein
MAVGRASRSHEHPRPFQHGRVDVDRVDALGDARQRYREQTLPAPANVLSSAS